MKIIICIIICLFLTIQAGESQNKNSKQRLALTSQDIAHGMTQIDFMQQDLPQIRKLLKQSSFFYNWGVRQFAGEAIGQRINWERGRKFATNYPPSISEITQPTSNNKAKIFIQRKHSTGTDIPAEEIWKCFVFECFNIQHHKEFRKIYEDAIHGRLDSDQYVKKNAYEEYLAQRETAKFYIDKIRPEYERLELATTPGLWGLGCPDTFEKWLALYYDHSYYPWSTYGNYYKNVIFPSIRPFPQQKN